MRRSTAGFVVAVVIALAGLRLPLAHAEEPPKELAALKYRSVGPYAGGRVSRACGVPGDPLTYYAATASGGVWKSADGGLTWKPVFDDQPTSSIGSIAVAASDPNVVYVGTREANIRGNVAPGAGIFKSTDGGKTWKHVWKQVGQNRTMAVHPPSGARSASRWPRRTRAVSTPALRPKAAACSGPTTAARRGPASTASGPSASGRGTTPRSPSTRQTRTWCSPRTCRS